MNAQRKEKLKRLLQKSRARLLKAQPDFAQPLRELIFVATKDVYHISTNGACVYFDPDWLQKLENASLDFILAHQLGHLQLRHFERPQYYRGDRFHLAADIVVNARLRAMGWQYEKLPGIGKIYYETFFPRYDGAELTAEQAMNGVPFDPAGLPDAKRRGYMIDSDRWWEASAYRGENGVVILRPGDPDPFDLFADDVVQNEKKPRLIIKEQIPPTLGPVDSSTSDEAESPSDPFSEDRPSAEAVRQRRPPTLGPADAGASSAAEESSPRQSWEKSAAEPIQQLRRMQKEQHQSGEQDAFTERLWQKPNRAGLDWRKLLQSFIKEEIYDYSFAPPDRRYQDDALFLPDFNVPEDKLKDVLFMVDTSGSVSDQMLSDVYREICGSLEQFNGALTGAIGFFDTQVRRVCPFAQIDDLQAMVPLGGGGTNYDCIFSWCDTVKEEPPCCIVIFTDGKAEFPDVSAAPQDVPVLWLFSTETAVAPWGQFAYVPQRPQ